MADDERQGRSGLPAGIVAAIFFIAGAITLFLLFADEDEPPRPATDTDIAGFMERVDERLEPVTLRPVASLEIHAANVIWRDRTGRPFLTSPSLTFAVRVGPAIEGDILIHDGVIQRLELNLVQGADGSWNYQAVLDPLLNGGTEGAGGRGAAPRVAMRDILLRDGSVRVDLQDALYRATDLEVALASATLSGPGVVDPVFRIARASTLLHLPDSAGGRVERRLALEDAVLRLADGALAFQIEQGAFGTSTFAAARGVWDPALGGLGLDAEVTVVEGRLADVPWLPGEVPEGTSGSFRLRIAPVGEARTALTVTDATISAPGSSASGSLTAVLGPGGIQLREVDATVDPLSLDLVEAFTGPLPYTGAVRGTIRGTGGEIRFDMTASLATSPAAEPFQTEVTGQVAFTDAGLEIRRVSADLDQVPLEALRQIAPGLPLAGPVSGTVTLEGDPGEAPINLDIRLEAGGGVITVAGMVDLRGTPPRYDLAGRLIGVELRRVLLPAAPPAAIHARFSLEGAGFEPATATAALAVNGTFTGWESQPGDTVAIRALVDDGLLRAESARLSLGPVRAAAEGEWRFARGEGGAIRYDLEVASLEPLSPYLPAGSEGQQQFARGQLAAEGTLTGTLDAPVVAGTVEASDFRFGEWAAERFTGEYDGRFEGELPRIDARFSGTELRTPAGDYESVTVGLDFTRPTFELAFQADQMDGGIVEIEAGGLIEEGRREVEIRRAEVDLQDQRWSLQRVAEIAWTPGGAVRVADLLLEQTGGGPGLLRLEGVVAPFDAADFDVEVRRLPVGDVIALLGADIELSGALTLEGTVRGPTEAPEVGLQVLLEDGNVRGVAVRRLAASVGYDDAALRLDGTGLLGDSARVDIDGTVPARITLGLPPTFELVEGAPLDVRIATAHFPLQTLDPGIRSVTDIVGRLEADIRVAGTAEQPQLSGLIDIESGALTVPALDQRYEDIHGTASLTGRELRVDSLVARSGGLARATGRIVFEDLTDPALELQASLDGFRAQGIDGDAEGAAAYGVVRLAGSLQAPRVTGDVRLQNGTVSIIPLQQAPRLSDAFLDAADPLAPLLEEDFDVGDPVGGGLRVSDLEVTAGEDVWFATEEARAQLAGTLIIDKEGEDVMIQGGLQGNQGTFTLSIGPRLTRRFDIVEASIRFFGTPEPNPALDITASRLVRAAEGRDVDVRIRVGGTLLNPSLNLASNQGQSLPESELFCFIALGRSCSEATALGAGAGLTDLFTLYGVTDLISGLDVPFDYFQVEMRPGVGLGEGLYVRIGEELDLNEPVDDLLLLGEFPLADVAQLWEGALEWRIDRQWTIEASLQPTGILRNAATGRALPSELLSGRQFFLGVRRRWTY